MTEILVIKPSSVGDILHGLQVAQSIKDQAPDSRITWVVRDRFAPLVETCATVDEVLYFRRGRGPRAFLALLRQIRARRYDTVLDFQGLARTGLMTLAARATHKIGRGDAREGAGLFYRQRAPLPAAGRQAHAVDILLQFLPLMGLRAELGGPLDYRPAPLAPIDPRLDGARPVLLCPHSRGAEKEWPGFAALADRLCRDRPDLDIVWDSEKATVGAPPAAGPRFIDTAGRTGLAELIALVAAARLVVANDSGPMHLAAALGRPVVALFGPSSPARFGPYPPGDPNHHVVTAPDGDLGRLDVDTVYKTVTDALAKPAPAILTTDS